jgi:CRP-like cAMP-binding protein
MSDNTIQGKVKTLPRGGYLVPTSVGDVQFGSPPETIKDTMVMESGTPRIFVVPKHTFHLDKGISVAELEFPIYYNFFIKGRKTYIVCTAEQKKQLLAVLQESLFGPEHIDIRNEYLYGEEHDGFPDLQAEVRHFMGNRTIDDYVKFCIFKHEKVKINDVIIYKKDENTFHLEDKGEIIAQVPTDIEYKIIYEIGAALKEPYQPPFMGITCLGPSHGFDPTDNTSGFIIWLNHHGIMMDPPVNSTEWLKDSNVNPKLINSVILTHCHADHDAGTFQKILEDEKITIYTTETIMDSFVRKYSSLTGLSKKRIYELFDFYPVIIGSPIRINGAEFWFHYALHSIPSLGFYYNFSEQSFYYTSDHLNSPEAFEELKEKGILPESRFNAMMDFPWHHKIIYHEAGIPPLHTPISYLNSLPKEIQKKTTVYHIAKKNFPKKTDLTLAKFGIENTVNLEVKPPLHQEAYKILDVLGHIDIFQDFPITKAKEFLAIVKEEKFKKGEFIVRKGTEGECFYIITLGNVKIEGIKDKVDKSFSTYEYFGEASLILGGKRGADVVAATDVTAYSITKNQFLTFIQGSQLATTFRNLAKVREYGAWSVISESKTLRQLTSAQKTQLESIMHLVKFSDNKILIKQGETFDYAYIIKSGDVEVLKDNVQVAVMQGGDFVGEIFSLQKHEKSNYTFKCMNDSEAFAIYHEDMINYIKKNPRVYMNLIYFYDENI